MNYIISTVTPLFCHGAYTATPELRVPSIRGVLRSWYRYLYGVTQNETLLLGGIIKDENNNATSYASKVSLRISESVENLGNPQVLIHKGGHRKSAFVNTSFVLQVRDSRRSLIENEKLELKKTIQAWLLMGGLGLRTTRGAGSLLWDQQPMNEAAYIAACAALFYPNHPRLRWALLSESFESYEAARIVASDTLAPDAFENYGYALGNDKPRKTSPLKFKVVALNNDAGLREYKILALFDRSNEHHITLANLKSAIGVLCNSRKPIGELLLQSTLYIAN